MAREFSSARTLRLVTQLASTTRAGLPITRTLSHLEENQHSRVLRRLWRAVGRDVAAGATFGEALARQSPPLPALCVELIAAGEQSGHLDVALAQLRRYYEMRAGLKRAAIGAAIYPSFVTVFGLGVLTLLRVLTATNKSAAFWGLMGTYATVGLVLVAIIYFVAATPPGRRLWGVFVLHVPLIGGAVRRLALARFSRTLSMMYTSGVSIEPSLERAYSATGNAIVRRSLERAGRRVADGETLSEALAHSRFVTPLMREALQTGELTGSLDDALQHMADMYEDEARVVLTALPVLIAPIMLIIIGGLVVFLYYTYYLKPYVIDPVNQLI